jgi:hypothetical protein
MGNEIFENAKPLITRLPSLNVDGSGQAEFTTGDLATPCVGIYFKNKKLAFFAFFHQSVKNRNIGVLVKKGEIQLQFPSNRSKILRKDDTNTDTFDLLPVNEVGVSVNKNESVSSPLKMHVINANNLGEFFDFFIANRKSVLNGKRVPNLYNKNILTIMENHFNNNVWSGEYYANVSKIWQCGWVGGAMSSYPLYLLGNSETKLRAIKTIDFLTSNVAPSGFFYGTIKDGIIIDDSFEYSTQKEGCLKLKHAHLIRKSGDALYFLFKHFKVITPKLEWVKAAKNCADAFVKLFNKYGTFGQFVNIETGEMQVGISSAGLSVVGALCKAYEYFNDEKYLQAAIKSGEFYYENYVAQGVTSGAPGEILTAPDSESSYAAVESYVILYEVTNDKKYLNYAIRSANLFSSWVVSYEYEWHTDCEFKKHNINTVGSVFANVQNKHSAPGICTASGDALYRLYKYTSNPLYLELVKDIAYFMPQCISTNDNPIYSWDYNHGDERGKLLEGYICERVNTSDWEGEDKVGGVFNSSCWPETCILLTYVELLHLPEFKND